MGTVGHGQGQGAQSRPADLRVPKTCATWAMPCGAWPGVRRLADGPWPVRWWDDLRLVGLKLIFVVVSGVVPVLRLPRRESWWKDAEILMLRHQFAVAQREWPKAHSRLTWPDRARLARLAGTPPVERPAAGRRAGSVGTRCVWHPHVCTRRSAVY